jgi:ATP-dependent Clp endopeptidase proteolytic subunit ClpP
MSKLAFALACLFQAGNAGETEDAALSMLLLGANPASRYNPLGVGRQTAASTSKATLRSGLPTMTFKRVSDGQNFKWDDATGALRPENDVVSLTARDVVAQQKPPGKPPGMPMVGAGDDKVDVMSRLLRDRIIVLGQQVDDEIANVLVAQMLYLAGDDPTADITMYINSPGGSVSAGMAIFDTMQFIPCDVKTVCFGTAASMGAFLLGAGTKGKRQSLPNSRIMIHQPLGGAQGQADDIEIQAQEILYIRSLLNQYLSDFTGQSLTKIEQDCDRDYFMSAPDAKTYGIIDEVLRSKIPTPNLQRPNLMEA